MSLAELVRTAWVALVAHKLRSLLTTLGIVIAVWTIVSVMAVISGMSDYVRTVVFSLSPDVFMVSRFGIITSQEEFLQAVKRKELTDEEIERLAELCQSCAEVGSSLDAQRPVHNGRRRIADVPVFGTTANYAGLQGLDLEAGRYFTGREARSSNAVAVIGAEVRDELFPRRDPLGRQIWIGGVPHRVIGVLTRRGNMLGQNLDLAVYLPRGQAYRMFGGERGRGLSAVVTVLVRARGGVDGVEGCRAEVVQVFRWLRHIPFRGPDPVGTVTAEAVQGTWQAMSMAMRVVVMIIAGISLVVGAIVVANIMVVSVVERTREIGLRLALGAKKRDIRRQFLVESALLALAGGGLGTAAGAVTAGLVDAHAPVPADVTASLVVLAMLTAGLTGVAAGLFPARKAANMVPVEALNHE